MQALLFSPHADEAAVLTTLLQQAGFVVRATRHLKQALETWPNQPSDLMMLVFPREQVDILKHIRQMRGYTAAPIVVLADMLSDDQRVDVLEEGADLVFTKPYSLRFLLAQIRALLRRNTGMPFFSLPTLSQGNLTLDPANRSAIVGEAKPVHLTQLEFRLLYLLMTHARQIVPAETIVEHVWGYSGEGNRELVRGLVQRLRSKIEPDPRTPKFIRTEAGIGYYFSRYDE
ncbi:MAG: response regulator transcription factor [Chloroflexi bacterium]|jgi:two-component system, OmpR family, KDP operon response regulator KdpE|nr:response regulator transcription factor [Chloroflexota bacterium]